MYAFNLKLKSCFISVISKQNFKFRVHYCLEHTIARVHREGCGDFVSFPQEANNRHKTSASKKIPLCNVGLCQLFLKVYGRHFLKQTTCCRRVTKRTCQIIYSKRYTKHWCLIEMFECSTNTKKVLLCGKFYVLQAFQGNQLSSLSSREVSAVVWKMWGKH